MTRFVGIFGSREGVSEEDVRALISQIPEGRGIVTGGCLGSGSVDEHAIKIAMERRMPVMIFPADWARLGLSAGPVRNRLVVRYAEVGRGISSKPRGKSRGTDGTEDLFRKAGKPVRVEGPGR